MNEPQLITGDAIPRRCTAAHRLLKEKNWNKPTDISLDRVSNNILLNKGGDAEFSGVRKRLAAPQLTLFSDRKVSIEQGHEVEFTNLAFDGCTFLLKRGSKASFTSCSFDGVEIQNTKLEGRIHLRSCHLNAIAIHGVSSASQCSISKCRVHLIRNIDSQDRCVRISKCELIECTLDGSDIQFAIDETRSRQCSVNLTRVNNSKFTNVAFDRAEFASTTRFENCSFSDCQMSKWTFHTLGKDYGGLTVSNRMGIRLIDPIEVLRRNFSGLNYWIQWFFVVLFFAPYGVFLAVQWWKHLLNPGEGESILLVQLAKYVVSAGASNSSWIPNYWSLLLVFFFLLLNCARVVLLWKTKQIEMDEYIQGVPTAFDLEAPESLKWKRLYSGVYYSSYVSPLIVIVNTILFLSTKTPY